MHNVCLFERSRVNLNFVRSAFGMAQTATFMTTLPSELPRPKAETHQMFHVAFSVSHHLCRSIAALWLVGWPQTTVRPFKWHKQCLESNSSFIC